MKISRIFKRVVFLAVLASILLSCRWTEDPALQQNYQKDFALADFDRIDIGESFVISVQSGAFFSVHANGYKSSVDDLAVLKIGSTLVIRYANSRSHSQPVSLSITMPAIVGVNLSGTCNAVINGFNYTQRVEMNLSGASTGTMNGFSDQRIVNLSGASTLTLLGKTEMIEAKVSGSSELYAYSLTAVKATIEASGASRARVLAEQSLKANASGAGVITYKGNPSLDVVVSGAGEVSKELN